MANNLEQLCIHTITTKPWSIDECISKYSQAGVGGISIWREAVQGRNLRQVNKSVNESGLSIVSYVRGGFFPSVEVSSRQKAIDDNIRIIDEAYELGAPLVVLVCGADPGQSLSESRSQIQDGIAACLDHAREADIKLGIEPLHPMYSDNRSAINTLKQANDMAIDLEDPMIGVTLDVFHTWWDDSLHAETMRCGINGKLFSYHICDWKTPTTDLLNDRGLMGEGCINLSRIGSWVAEAGFYGFHEVEIFSDRYWGMDQDVFLQKIIEAWDRLNPTPSEE